MTEQVQGTLKVKTGFAEMMKGGVIMDVVNPEQAKIAEDAGAVAVMALERVPADIRAHGGVARMSDLVHSIEEALEEIKKYPAEDVYCIGGDSIYAQMLPYCDVAHVTKIDFAYEADSHFPNLDEDDEWEITGESDEQTYFDLEYQFVKYERKK